VRPGSRTKVSVPLVLYRIVNLRSCDFIDLSREVIEFYKFVIPPVPACRGTGAKRSGPAVSFLSIQSDGPQ